MIPKQDKKFRGDSKGALYSFRSRSISNEIHKAITNGINFLAKGQEKDGSFFCLVSTEIDDYKPLTFPDRKVRGKNASTTYTVPAIVPTNIVLSSLINISESDIAKNIKQKAAKFLLGEKGEYWSFNYWFRKSDWYKKEPYPDDTDDTFCALAALYEYNPKLFGGEVMARIVTMLTSAEEKEGGPYDMWLVPPKARKKWRDIDLVCNSNIAYFLFLQDISLPKLNAYIEKSIDEKDYEFPYNKIYPGIYFISRFYRGKKTKQMTDLLLKKQEADGKWENPLRTAIAISSFVNFEGFKHKRQLEKGVDYLIKTQGPNGSWEPYSFYFQMRTKKKTLYAGSSFITTALCLEAIQKFKNQNAKIKTTIQNSKIKNETKKIYANAIQRYRQRFSGFSRDFQGKASAVANKILKKNKDIVLLPYYFASSLHQNRNSKFKIHNSDLLIRLGEANLHGWIAYTIYDDFLDEDGDPKQLSIANVCLRESAEIFGNVLSSAKGFSAFSKEIFDTIDGANMWEVTRCRAKFPISNFQFPNFPIPDFGDYSQLADKSLGHALGPAAILFALGYKVDSAAVKDTCDFLGIISSPASSMTMLMTGKMT